jgi:hypothetical protein
MALFDGKRKKGADNVMKAVIFDQRMKDFETVLSNYKTWINY